MDELTTEDIEKRQINMRSRDSARYVKTQKSHSNFRTEGRVYHKHQSNHHPYDQLPEKKKDAVGSFFEDADRPIEKGLEARYRHIHQDSR